MTKLLCHVGSHAWVTAHQSDESRYGPPRQVCRRCHKERASLVDGPKGMTGFFMGGGSGGG